MKKVGDKIWLASRNPIPATVPCSICAGNLILKVELGSGEMVIVDCGYCQEGYGPSTGWERVWSYTPRAIPEMITKVEVESSFEGEKVSYFTLRGRAYDWFDDEASALARAKEMAAEREKEDREQARHRKDGSMRSLTWSIGYHRRSAQKAREEAERHERHVSAVKAEIAEERR